MLLRVALGIGVLIQAGVDLKGQAETNASFGIADWLAAAAGISLVVGVVTPVSALVVGLTAAAVWLSVLPAASLFVSRVPAGFVAAVAVAVALLGPGAFSLDARLFGLREIIIPPYSPSGSDRDRAEEDD